MADYKQSSAAPRLRCRLTSKILQKKTGFITRSVRVFTLSLPNVKPTVPPKQILEKKTAIVPNLTIFTGEC